MPPSGQFVLYPTHGARSAQVGTSFVDLLFSTAQVIFAPASWNKRFIHISGAGLVGPHRRNQDRARWLSARYVRLTQLVAPLLLNRIPTLSAQTIQISAKSVANVIQVFRFTAREGLPDYAPMLRRRKRKLLEQRIGTYHSSNGAYSASMNAISISEPVRPSIVLVSCRGQNALDPTVLRDLDTPDGFALFLVRKMHEEQLVPAPVRGISGGNLRVAVASTAVLNMQLDAP